MIRPSWNALSRFWNRADRSASARAGKRQRIPACSVVEQLEDRVLLTYLELASGAGSYAWSLDIGTQHIDHTDFPGSPDIVGGFGVVGAYHSGSVRHLFQGAAYIIWNESGGDNEFTGAGMGTFDATYTYTIKPDAGEADGDTVFVSITTFLSRIGGSTRSASISVGAESFDPIEGEDSAVVVAEIGQTITIHATGTANGTVSAPGPAQINQSNVTIDATVDILDLAAGQLEFSGVSNQELTYAAAAPFALFPDHPVNVSFVWASGPNAADQMSVAKSLTVTSAEDQSGTLAFSELGARPAGASHLLLFIDHSDDYQEADEENNVVALELPFELSVVAQFDNKGTPTDNQFGTYLTGVNLPTQFTVTSTGGAIANIRFAVSGLSSATQTKPFQVAGTIFTFNPGQLPDDATLTVTALDSDGDEIGQIYTGTLVVNDTLNFELELQAGDGKIAAENARFFNGFTATPEFSGTVTGLSSFYLNQTTVLAGATGMTVAWASNSSSLTQTFTASSLNVGSLPVGPINGDLQVGTQHINQFNDTFEVMTSVAQPTWISGAIKSFNANTGAYVFDNAQVNPVKQTAAFGKTRYDWIDEKLAGLQSSALLQMVLDIHASVDKSAIVTFDTSELKANATLLGQELVNETYSSSTLVFGGTLDKITLDPNGLSVRFANPLQIADRTFLDQNFTFDPVQKAAKGIPKWLVKAEFGFDIKITGALTLDGGITITKGSSGIQYVAGTGEERSGTYVKLTAIPSVAAVASLDGEILEGFVGAIFGSVSGTASLDVSTLARFSGAITSAPTVSAAKFSVNFKLQYRLQLIGTLLKGKIKFVDYDSDKPENGGPSAHVIGPIELFSVSTKKKPPK